MADGYIADFHRPQLIRPDEAVILHHTGKVEGRHVDVIHWVCVDIEPLGEPCGKGRKPCAVVVPDLGRNVLVEDEIVEEVNNKSPVKLIDILDLCHCLV